MSSPVEFRVVLERTDDNPSALAPSFTVIIVADDLADATDKADDLARTLKGFRVADIRTSGPASESTGQAASN